MGLGLACVPRLGCLASLHQLLSVRCLLPEFHVSSLPLAPLAVLGGPLHPLLCCLSPLSPCGEATSEASWPGVIPELEPWGLRGTSRRRSPVPPVTALLGVKVQWRDLAGGFWSPCWVLLG